VVSCFCYHLDSVHIHVSFFSGYKEYQLQNSSRWFCPIGWDVSYAIHVVFFLRTGCVYYPIWVCAWNFSWDSIETFRTRFLGHKSRWYEGTLIWLIGDTAALCACLLANPHHWLVACVGIVLHWIFHVHATDTQLRIETWIQTLAISAGVLLFPLEMTQFSTVEKLVLLLASFFRFFAHSALIKSSWNRRKQSSLLVFTPVILVIIFEVAGTGYYFLQVPLVISCSLSCILLAPLILFHVGVQEDS